MTSSLVVMLGPPALRSTAEWIRLLVPIAASPGSRKLSETGVPWCSGAKDHAGVFVLLDRCAMFAHQRFDFHLVEPAPRQNDSRTRTNRAVAPGLTAKTTWSMSVSMLIPVSV